MMRTKRKTLMEERYYVMQKKRMKFIDMIQERVAKSQTCLAPYFSNDLVFKIFLLLPIKSLLRFSCVCKSWYELIRCAEFVEAYNTRAETMPILFRSSELRDKSDTFHVETQLDMLDHFSIFPGRDSAFENKFIHFLEIEGEKGKIIDANISSSGSILAACNGLVLISSMCFQPLKTSKKRTSLEPPLMDCHEKPGRIIIMNPMTRKLIGFPMGTLPYVQNIPRFRGYNNNCESYGLVFSHSTGVYKVVHLFKDKSQHIACEILTLQTRSWKAVDGPTFGAIRKLGHVPVSAIGALHWLPDTSGHNYIVSMDADSERFSTIHLPKTLGRFDRLLEMGGFLSLVKSLDKDHLEVWILKGLEETEWIKQHTIHIDAILGFVENEEFSIPAFALNAKQMVFRRRKTLYSYDFELEEIKEIEIENEKIKPHEYESFIIHSNNLATWEHLEPMS